VSEAEALLKNAAWLRQGTLAQLLAVLNADGEEARVVGGAVRNALLGEPIGEIDLATTAVPEEVVRRATAAGFKPVPTGIEHGTVTVVIEGQPFEVTTLRQDIETFGRHANVRFGRDWQKDAERRDFTMNALSVSSDGTVYDYVGGIADLHAHRVRFIGDAATRIAEDHLRILRFFRFHAAYGHGLPDRAGLNACIAARQSLDQLSRERVRMELLKLLPARHAAPVLAVMSESGLLGRVLGGVADLASFENLAKIETALLLQGDPVRRLGALATRVTEDAERLWQRLRLSNAEHERIKSMSQGWWRISPANEQSARVLLYRSGPERYLDRVLMAWAHSPSGVRDEAWRALSTLSERWIAPVFPIKASELIARGVPHGPAVGVALRAAEEAWLAADFPADQTALAGITAAATAIATQR
jgi:tRNA nucleotidyltransferase/poly(A) polymerase